MTSLAGRSTNQHRSTHVTCIVQEEEATVRSLFVGSVRVVTWFDTALVKQRNVWRVRRRLWRRCRIWRRIRFSWTCIKKGWWPKVTSVVFSVAYYLLRKRDSRETRWRVKSCHASHSTRHWNCHRLLVSLLDVESETSGAVVSPAAVLNPGIQNIKWLSEPAFWFGRFTRPTVFSSWVPNIQSCTVSNLGRGRPKKDTHPVPMVTWLTTGPLNCSLFYSWHDGIALSFTWLAPRVRKQQCNCSSRFIKRDVQT